MCGAYDERKRVGNLWVNEITGQYVNIAGWTLHNNKIVSSEM